MREFVEFPEQNSIHTMWKFVLYQGWDLVYQYITKVSRMQYSIIFYKGCYRFYKTMLKGIEGESKSLNFKLEINLYLNWIKAKIESII